MVLPKSDTSWALVALVTPERVSALLPTRVTSEKRTLWAPSTALVVELRSDWAEGDEDPQLPRARVIARSPTALNIFVFIVLPPFLLKRVLNSISTILRKQVSQDQFLPQTTQQTLGPYRCEIDGFQFRRGP